MCIFCESASARSCADAVNCIDGFTVPRKQKLVIRKAQEESPLLFGFMV